MQGEVFQPNYINIEYFFGAIYNFIISLFSGDFGRLLQFLGILASIIAIILICVTIYSWVRTYEINQKEAKTHKELFASHHVKISPEATPSNPRWEQVQKHMRSESSSDWRLAILEADLMLEDLLNTLGYEGNTIGEKLKSTDASKFPGYQTAWQAHLVRNNIAHQGSSYILGKAESRRVISMFEDVFKMNHYI